MKEDVEGFEYPLIDYARCIGCYKCIKVCPIKKQESYGEKAK